MLHWHWYGIRRVRLANMCSYDFAPMIFNKNKDYLTLPEPSVRLTWFKLEHYSGYVTYSHCWWFCTTLEWYTEGKVDQYVLLWFCSYDFAPMILTKQGLPDPYSSLMWGPPEPYFSTIAAMHPTSIFDDSVWHCNGIRRVRLPNMCSYDFAPMILLLWFLTKTRTKPHHK